MEEQDMKKLIALLLVSLMIFSLAACGNGNEETKTETTAVTDATETLGTAETDSGSDSSNVLIMATEAGFAPYEYTEDGSTVVGVDVDIANEIAKAMGKELRIENMSFDGALLAVQQGKADFAAAGISITEERAEVMDFSIEYTTSKQVIVVNKNAGVVSSIGDLTADIIVGVQTGTVADFYVQDELESQLKQYGKFMEAAMDLKNNKIDCIIMDALPAEEMVNANDDLIILEEEVFTDRYAIAVQKGNTEMLDTINGVLESLIAEGKIDEFIINHTTQ